MITLYEINQLDILASQHLERLHDFNITGVSIDSRNVDASQLFFAIIGERYDAHVFLDSVLAKGVGACCVNKSWFDVHGHSFPDQVFIVVEDTTQALGRLANAYRKKFKIPFVAVAGSNGKTTTKEMLGCVLSQKYSVLKTEGNLNNHIGVPLTLFKVTAIHEVAVVEIGTNHFGEIAYLCEILEPDFCVMTNIGREHLEFFKDVEGVAKAEAELFSYIEKANKFACINGDDAWIVKTSQAIKDKITYGFSNTFDIHATFLGLDTMAMPEFKIAYKGQETYMKLKVPGEHAVSNAIAAFAIGVVLDVSPSQIKKGLEDYQAFSKRMEVIQKNGVTIINDCYNANPDSMLAALKTLSQIKTSGKRIAVLGDMAELGERSRDAHHEMGQTIINSGIDCLYTVGKDIELTTLAAGKTMKEAHHFEGKESLIEYLKNLVAKKDVLLVKGSRSMKLEEVLDALFPVV